MNLFYDLPDELQEKIHREIHRTLLKSIHVEIKYGWPLCRKMIYKKTIYKYFLNCEMSNVSVRIFNTYLDFKKGKILSIQEDNVYIKMEPFFDW